MGEPIKPVASHSHTHHVSDDEEDTGAYKDAVSEDSGERRRSREIDDHSQPARTDATAWHYFFCDQMSGIFQIFKDQAMYDRYIRSEGKALDAAIMQEREDERMHERWERLRESFHEVMDAVLDKDDDRKRDLRKPVTKKVGIVESPPLPFDATWIGEPAGLTIRVARVFMRTDPTVPRLSRRTSRVDQTVKQAPQMFDHTGQQHAVEWLRLQRRLDNKQAA